MSIKNPYHPNADRSDNPYMEEERYLAFNEGVKAAVQYLEAPCADHPSQDLNTYISHRKDCPLCMKQIYEELEQ